jgi:hypothetical protein
LLRRALADRPLRRESRTSRSARADIGQGLGQYRKGSMKRWGEVLCWVFFGVAILLLAAWPLMIWWHVKGGAPFVPAMLETLPYPLGVILFWIIARVLRAFAHDRGRAWLTAGRVEWARTETLVGHRPLPMRQGPNYRSWGVATAKCSRWRDRLAFRLLALVDRHPADKRVWLEGHGPLGKSSGKSPIDEIVCSHQDSSHKPESR